MLFVKAESSRLLPCTHGHQPSEEEALSPRHPTPCTSDNRHTPTSAASRAVFQMISFLRQLGKSSIAKCIWGSCLIHAFMHARLSGFCRKKMCLVEQCFSNFLDHHAFPSAMKHPSTSPGTWFGKRYLCVHSPLPQFSREREI